jgi:hypothetical protein
MPPPAQLAATLSTSLPKFSPLKSFSSVSGNLDDVLARFKLVVGDPGGDVAHGG